MTKKISVEDVYRDLGQSSNHFSPLHRQIQEDFKFSLGKQWDDEDSRKLEKAGVTPLTINQIKPIIKIITGIERQSRSDLKAFPVGDEDELAGDIVSRLLKHANHRASLDSKQSEQFKEGVTGGLCYIEPYLDYTYNLINGELKFRKISANRIFYDPSSEEYDLSDSRYLIKMTYDLSKDQLLELFPDKEKEIDGSGFSKVNFDDLDKVADKIQTQDYEFDEEHRVSGESRGKGYDLLEYYYKSPKDIFYVVDKATGGLVEFDTKSEAEGFIATGQFSDPVIILKKVPEIRLKQIVGAKEMSDEVAWFYPKWKGYSIVPFFAERFSVDFIEETLRIQGIARALKDLQIELNKSRTLELRHLNSTANSGWMFPEKMMPKKNMEQFKTLGSSPGFVTTYDPEKTGGIVSAEMFRLAPAPLPQGHMALSSERINEIKTTSGVNPDLLANDSQSQSGRAILLKQRQGLVMVQEMLDNYGKTKKIIGRFVLSQLSEIYTVETAAKVLGEAFIQEHFSRPQVDETGEIVTDESGNMVEDVDPNELRLILNKILGDESFQRFDVSIGEGPYNETVKYTNYLMLLEMAEKGLPIPPESIINESLLDESQKKKILASIQTQRQAQESVNAG